MIKKNTTIIFEGGKTFELKGGMPLSKGEIVNFNSENNESQYEVINKKIDYSLDGEDHIISVTYTLKKK